MAAVIGVPPYLQFFDSNGDPLSGGKIYTYAAGTTTPKATYTTAAGDVEADNPIDLDASGIPDTANGSMWLVGSYKFVVKDSLGNTIRTTDNVTSFTTLAAANNAYFESFSGTGSQTSFTTSQDLGTEEKGLMIFVNKGLQSTVTNGGFTTDTDWTEGAGWTIAAGVATAAGAISTALSQTAPVTLIEGNAYAVTITITRSAGGLIPSIGGQNGTERTASGTYREIIIAGSSQIIAFTGNAFTGTLDNVVITPAVSAGYDILPPTAYTINGTTLTFTTAPAAGTNNIDVFAPSLSLGAASAAAGAAAASAAAALASEVNAGISAASAMAFAVAKNQWTFSSTTAMAAPGTGNLRLNNATLASVTAIAISELSSNSGNPDLASWLDTWDAGSGSNRGQVFLFKDSANFAIYTINTTNVDNAGWKQLSVTYVASAGTLTNADLLGVGFAHSGETTVIGGITAGTGDVTFSGSGSVATTIANSVVTEAKMVLADNTTHNASTSAHGFLKKLSNVATEFMNGVGNWVSVTERVKASVLFDGTTADNATGTYSQNAFTVTVTVTGHNQQVGHVVQSVIGSGTAVTGTYIVASVIDANNFTYTAGTSLVTSGTITLTRRLIRGSNGIANITYISTGRTVANFSTAMSSANYRVLPGFAFQVGVSAIMSGRDKSGVNPTTMACYIGSYQFSGSSDNEAYTDLTFVE